MSMASNLNRHYHHHPHNGILQSNLHLHHSAPVLLGPSSSKHWHSETSEVLQPKTSDQIFLERNIWAILTDFNPNATLENVVDTQKTLIKLFEKNYNKSARPTITTKTIPTATTINMAPKKQSDNGSVELQPRASGKSHNTISTITKVAQPKVINRVNQIVKHKDKNSLKIPRELMSLVGSDGFVSKPPSEKKRSSKGIVPYDATKYEQSPRRRLKKRTFEGHSVRPSHNKCSSQIRHKESMAKVEVQRTAECATSFAQTAAENFKHNKVKIIHYPLVEVKIEPSD
ncbi:uncharacterized protein LOC116342576 [Contarinia nasturtii]|uniref:uncharacterized protein LOC116342576 n=1 Tax=Contarinia nasturtii TaxID=265458 RepID=UPI0012D489D1|nr:uncharacterized protein LOC116342576 [Contarinia nasturtii]